MIVGDLVRWVHEYTGETSILYIVEVVDENTIKCLFPYGAYQTMKKSRVTLFDDYKDHKPT